MDDYNKIVSYGPIHLLAAPSLGAETHHSRTDQQDLGGMYVTPGRAGTAHRPLQLSRQCSVIKEGCPAQKCGVFQVSWPCMLCSRSQTSTERLALCERLQTRHR